MRIRRNRLQLTLCVKKMGSKVDDSTSRSSNNLLNLPNKILTRIMKKFNRLQLALCVNKMDSKVDPSVDDSTYRSSMKLLDLPDEILTRIMRNMSYEEMSQHRMVS